MGGRGLRLLFGALSPQTFAEGYGAALTNTLSGQILGPFPTGAEPFPLVPCPAGQAAGPGRVLDRADHVLIGAGDPPHSVQRVAGVPISLHDAAATTATAAAGCVIDRGSARLRAR
jgi:hypothetical protein